MTAADKPKVPKGGPYPPPPPLKPGPYDGSHWPNDKEPLARVVALGVCERCGWVHTTCKAHLKRVNNPCGNIARLGQLVCRHHGGNLPQSKAKAAERIATQEALGEVGKLLAASRLVVEGRSGVEQLENARDTAAMMAHAYGMLLARLPIESEWSYIEPATDGAPVRWVKIADDGLIGPDARGQMRLHAYEEGLRHWTKLHGELLRIAATIGLEERRQLFEEQQVAKIGTAIEVLVAGLGRSLDDPAVVPVVESALRMIADGPAIDTSGAEVGP